MIKNDGNGLGWSVLANGKRPKTALVDILPGIPCVWDTGVYGGSPMNSLSFSGKKAVKRECKGS